MTWQLVTLVLGIFVVIISFNAIDAWKEVRKWEVSMGSSSSQED